MLSRSVLNTLKDLTFDNIYHEHFNYWSLTTLCKFLNKLDLIIYNAEKINTHGGSIRVYVTKDHNIKIDEKVKKLLQEEENFGLSKLETYYKFGKKIENLKENVLKNIKILRKDSNKFRICCTCKSNYSFKLL